MTRETAKPPAEWDRHSIKAEIHRRGMSLSGIARDAGLAPNACRMALMGLNRKGADAISGALGIPFDTLFPVDWYVHSRSNHVKPTKKASHESHGKRVAASGARAGS